jgi:hypothetical protein
VQLIGWKDKDSRLLVDVEEIGLLDRLSRINEEANCVRLLLESTVDSFAD